MENQVSCPCGTEVSYEACCGRYISGQQKPSTTEALMRSRYTAYVMKDANYLMATLFPEKRTPAHSDGIREWMALTEWHHLKVIRSKGGVQDEVGEVEFVAYYSEKGSKKEHHELSTFQKEGGVWYFVDGTTPTTSFKIGRNDPCPCQSGKKYKKCCGK